MYSRTASMSALLLHPGGVERRTCLHPFFTFVSFGDLELLIYPNFIIRLIIIEFGHRCALSVSLPTNVYFIDTYIHCPN